MNLSFSCGTTSSYSAYLLGRMSYFEPWTCDNPDMSDEIRVPCSAIQFASLVDGFKSDSKITSTLAMTDMIQVADQLGYRSMSKLTSLFLQKITCENGNDPIMAKARASRCMVDIVGPIGYMAGPKVPADAFLFKDVFNNTPGNLAISQETIDHFFDKHIEKEDDDDDDDDHIPNIPNILRKLLHKHRGHLVLAGGSVCGILTRSDFSDYDLFVYDMDSIGADLILDDIAKELQPGDWYRTTSRNATTFVNNTIGENIKTVIQIIFRLNKSVQDVLESFDFAPAMVGAWFEADGVKRIAAMEEFVVAINQGAFQVITDRWSSASISRVLKYSQRGFNAYLPGLDRSSVVHFDSKLQIHVRDNKYYLPTAHKNIESCSALGLLYAEQWLADSPIENIENSIIKVIRQMRGQSSGYDHNEHPFKNNVRRFFWAVKGMIKKLTRFYNGSNANNLNDSSHMANWVANVTGVFSPIKSYFGHIHDQPKCSIIAAHRLEILANIPELSNPLDVYKILSGDVYKLYNGQVEFLEAVKTKYPNIDKYTTIDQVLERVHDMQTEIDAIQDSIKVVDKLFTSQWTVRACKHVSTNACLLDGLATLTALTIADESHFLKCANILCDVYSKHANSVLKSNTPKKKHAQVAQTMDRLLKLKEYLTKVYVEKGATAYLHEVKLVTNV